VGTSIFDPRSGEFSLHKGPIFTEILLADEVNRTPPKSQSALLEGMEERQVTIDGTKHALPDMFFVIATQNPVEYEGTYPLPETQLDRFMMKVILDYPSAEAELDVARSYAKGIDLHNLDALIPSPLVKKNELLHMRKQLRGVVVREEVLTYMQRIVAETRDPLHAQLGASTRAVVALLKAARTVAAMRGLTFVTPDEVKDVTLPVLRHRLILKPEVLIDGLTPDYFLTDILRRVPVPR
jgi:MoxR-like ATPase